MYIQFLFEIGECIYWVSFVGYKKYKAYIMCDHDAAFAPAKELPRTRHTEKTKRGYSRNDHRKRAKDCLYVCKGRDREKERKRGRETREKERTREREEERQGKEREREREELGPWSPLLQRG